MAVVEGFRLGHGNAGGWYEIDFDVVALVAADAVPLVAAILNVGGNADSESQGSVKEARSRQGTFEE